MKIIFNEIHFHKIHFDKIHFKHIFKPNLTILSLAQLSPSLFYLFPLSLSVALKTNYPPGLFLRNVLAVVRRNLSYFTFYKPQQPKT